MILLDTDHLTSLKYEESESYDRLVARMEASDDQDFAITIISVEEQMRGWLARIHSSRNIDKQIEFYLQLELLYGLFQKWKVVRFDRLATNEFKELRRRRIRIGTQDLKIASIALANDVLLLSANLRDFERVPGLKVEDWTAR